MHRNVVCKPPLNSRKKKKRTSTTPACFYFRVSGCKQKDVPSPETAVENMTKLELLNVFLNDRMTAAAEEIFRAVKDTVVEYQSEILRSKEENERLKRLLNVAVQRLLLQPGEDRPAAGGCAAATLPHVTCLLCVSGVMRVTLHLE